MNIKIYKQELADQVSDLASRHELRRFSARSGMSYSWLSKFGAGKITNPTINKLDELRQHLIT